MQLPKVAFIGKNPSGANPTITIYNATGSLARFENKNIIFYF
jgi:hypothetical protein